MQDCLDSIAQAGMPKAMFQQLSLNLLKVSSFVDSQCLPIQLSTGFE